MFHISYNTWESVCTMYQTIPNGLKRSYLQWYPFAKMNKSDFDEIKSQSFFERYICSGAFVLSSDIMFLGENYLTKKDCSFRDAGLLSPILFLVLQCIGKEISVSYQPQRQDDIEVIYSGNYSEFRPYYKKDYDRFVKMINSCQDSFDYYIKTDVTQFYSNIRLELLLGRINEICNKNEVVFSQTQLQLYKSLLAYCGRGRFPLLQNSLACSYLSTVVYLDETDKLLFRFIQDNVPEFSHFIMIRYVDDLYIMISTSVSVRDVHAAFNRIINQYSSILKEWGLAINSTKVKIKPTEKIADELKNSLYDEYVNGIWYDIGNSFQGSFPVFLQTLKRSLSTDSITIEKYNSIIEESFYREGIHYLPNEVLNYYVYSNNSEIRRKKNVELIATVIANNLDVMYLDPKRLTIMVLQTHDGDVIKSFVANLFQRHRSDKWNAYDTMIAVTYLLQRNFKHSDLMNCIKEQIPLLYNYITCYCSSGWMHRLFQDQEINLWNRIISSDSKCYYFYFMSTVEVAMDNLMVAYAYYKNYFDRVTAHMAHMVAPEIGSKRPNFKKYYKDGVLKKFYSDAPDSLIVLEEAYRVRNTSPLAHSSAELLDRNTSSTEIIDSIHNLESILKWYRDNNIPPS